MYLLFCEREIIMTEMPEKKPRVPKKPGIQEIHKIDKPRDGRVEGKAPKPISEPKKDPPEVNKPTDMKPKEPITDSTRKPGSGKIGPGKPGENPPIHISIVRPRDLLLLNFTFINFKVFPGSTEMPAKLKTAKTSKPAYVIVEFPQQSIIEEAFFQETVPEKLPVPIDDVDHGTDDETPREGDIPIASRISGTSRLVFKSPNGAKPIPYTIEGLLGIMCEYPLVVSATAKPPDLNLLTPNLTLTPEMVLESSKRYEFVGGRALATLKERYSEKSLSKSKTNSTAKSSMKTLPVENQYSLNQQAMQQSYAKLRSERSQLMTTLESISSAILEVIDASVVELIKPELQPPTEYETSIEAPLRLILSPNKHATWAHAVKEVVSTQKILYGLYPATHQAVKTKQVASRSSEVKTETAAKTIRKTTETTTVNNQKFEKPELEQLIQVASFVAKVPVGIHDFQFLFENIDWVELWHTRLATRLDESIDENPNPLRTVRAIWAKDEQFKAIVDNNYPDPYNKSSPSIDDPYRTSLDAYDRYNFVHLSANYRLKESDFNIDYKPLAIPVERMMLSSLGSWLNLRGAWNPTPEHLIVEEWRHRSTMARDHYVRVVYKGYLFPFGHRASLIKVTERKFHNNLSSNPALLRQRMFIVVREPERIYPLTNIKENNKSYDLSFPFTRVRITTLVTPLLADPDNSQINGKGRLLFRVRDGSTKKDFRFNMVAEDLEGRELEFSLPMIFVEKSVRTDEDSLNKACWDYTGIPPGSMGGEPPSTNLPAEPANLNSQAVCFAPSLEQGDTTLNTKAIWFGAYIPNSISYSELKGIYSPDIAQFYPRIERASALIPAIQHLAGNDGVAEFKYPSVLLENGFAAGNEGGLFAELIDTLPLQFSCQSQRSGGLLSPDININSLSRKYGPVGGEKGNLGEIVSDNFNPVEFFNGMSPKLFGAIDLFELLGAVGGPPTFITKAMTPLQGLFQNLQNLQNQLETLGEIEPNLQTLINALNQFIQDAIGYMSEIMLSITSAAPTIDVLEDSVNILQEACEKLIEKIDEVIPALNATGIPASVRIVLEDALNRVKVALQDLLDGITNVSDFIERLIQLNQLITEQKITLDWNKELNNWPTGDPIFEGEGGKAKLNLHAEVDGKSSQKGTPAFTTSCGLHKFNLNLIGKNTEACFMILRFDKVEFVYTSGSKADVNVEFGGVQFEGVLSFVEALKSLIPLDGFSDPPGLEISAEGITASYSLALPNLAMGVFSMTNMSLAAGFSIPFIGDPLSVWFSFCTRENPFTLTVSMFGGGGFFGITLQPSGLKCLEASFEFGASISVDFGVASGGVHAMAGIYFKMETKNDRLEATLTGYFRMGGYLSVLGIISVSIELYLSLTYETATGKCTGVAELTIEVEVLFFSVSVKVRAERKFSGSNGDPTFAELMEPYPDPVDSSIMVDPWEKYCKAFA
jgi:hypothetical protein